MNKDLGLVTAYAYAVSKGYTGTEEEFAELMASYASVAEQAAQSAEAADESAEDSEAFAVGKRDGVDVTSDDPAYHNNAKYYAEQAAGSATAASELVTTFTETTAPAAVQAVNTAGQTQIGAVNTAGQTALTAVGEARTAAVNAVQQKGEEVLESIPEDYTDLTEDVSDLKSAVTLIGNLTGLEEDITNLFTFTQGEGVYYKYNGQTSSSTAASRSNFVDISKYQKIRVTMRKVTTSNTEYGVAFYTAAAATAEAKIAVSDGGGIREQYDTTAESVTVETREFPVPTGANYMRTTWIKNNQPYYSDYTFSCIGIIVSKLTKLPDAAETDGKYIIQQTNGMMTLTTADDYAKKEEFETIDAEINNVHHFINYGYDIPCDYAANPSSTDSQILGIKRVGQAVTLNCVGLNKSITVKLNQGVERTVVNDTVKGWEATITLEQDMKYLFNYKVLSGINSGLIGISVYKSGTSSTVGSYEYDSINKVYTRTVTGDGGLYNICLYIPSNTVLDNFKILVTVEKIEESIKKYYIEEMSDTIAKVRNEMTSPALVFPWITDIHRYSSNATSQNFDEMIANMTKLIQNVKCDFILNTGDLTDGNTVQATTLARSYASIASFRNTGIPHIWSQGNHDTNYAYSGTHPYLFTLEECYKAYFTCEKGMKYNPSTNATDFYIDFEELNTRLISLNANYCSGYVEYAYSTDTVTWLGEALNTQKNVIVAVHQSPITTQVYNNGSTSNASGIVSELQAFVNNGGNLIMISGHSHLDLAFISPWLSVMEDCQRFTETAGIEYSPTDTNPMNISGFIGKIVKPARANDSYTKDAWTVCVYKPDSNELSLIRFGAGCDRYFHVAPIAPVTLTTKLTGTITWSSSDTSVATVADGIVTGVATGKCAVLATDGTGNYECWIVSVE